ncbi:MAG: hypothetical protein ACPLRN_03000 [Microgenomates group bacterium]
MKKILFINHRNFSKTIIFSLIIIFLLIFFILTIGIRLILNFSIFIANFFPKKTINNETSKPTPIYGTFTIDEIPTATNSSHFIVSGSLVNYDKLEFYLNGNKIKEKQFVNSDYFSEELDGLKEGENDFYVKASIKDSPASTKKSQIYKIILKTEKPKIEITEPADKSTVSNQEIFIKGKTDKEVFIKVNDMPVTVDVNGNFITSIRLKEGENIIQIQANDIAGNITTQTLTINYQKD